MNILRPASLALLLAAANALASPPALAGDSLAPSWLAQQFSTTHTDPDAARPGASAQDADGHAFARAWLARQLGTAHEGGPVVERGTTMAADDAGYVRLWLHRQFSADHMPPRG